MVCLGVAFCVFGDLACFGFELLEFGGLWWFLGLWCGFLLVVAYLLVSLVLVVASDLVYFVLVGGCGGELVGDLGDVLGGGFGFVVLVVEVEGVVPDSGRVGWAGFECVFPDGCVLGGGGFVVFLGDVVGELLGGVLVWVHGVACLEVVFCLEAREVG